MCKRNGSSEWEPELVAALHTSTRTCGNDYDGCFLLHKCQVEPFFIVKNGHLKRCPYIFYACRCLAGGGCGGGRIAPFCLGWANIMRPATVCRTRVTVTSIVVFMYWRPFSTTIMVPSSR